MVKWQRELDIFSEIKTTFILEDNIYDVYCDKLDYNEKFAELDEYLVDFLHEKGYFNIIFFDPINGFYNRHNHDTRLVFQYLENCIVSDDEIEIKTQSDHYLGEKVLVQDLVSASRIIKRGLIEKSSVVFIMQFASRYCTKPDIMELEEREIFMNLLYGTLNSQAVYMEEKGIKKNLLFLIVDKLNDLPTWFYLNHPYEKTITISKPDKEARSEYIDFRQGLFSGYIDGTVEEQEQFREEIIRLTEGMRCIEINGLRNLCNKEGIQIQNIQDGVTLYKYGIRENPWKSIPSERLKKAEDIIKERVKGQDACVQKVANIIKRAAGGMSGLQHSSNSKPKGIMFFAGPTGTGKTEMAKALAELLFDDENHCIRFDMSEYQQPHSDQKLLGAPPGYVGYEAGGQLTNAIRKNPFSIVLFDEIEKAHPSILDKFLQILEDGRMTDGQGNTVYFSESIIIFTSNLGVYRQNEETGGKEAVVKRGEDYNKIQAKIVEGVRNYFKHDLGRPEILNRIGNNIIVFNYITDDAAQEIMDSQISHIRDFIKREQGINVLFTDIVKQELEQKILKDAENIENGGRGIGNAIEEYISNPLAAYIFDNQLLQGTNIQIWGIEEENHVIKLKCEVN